MEKIVKEQMDEIKMLKKICSQFQREIERSGVKMKPILEKQDVTLEIEVAGDIKAKGIVVENYLNPDEDFDGVDLTV